MRVEQLSKIKENKIVFWQIILEIKKINTKDNHVLLVVRSTCPRSLDRSITDPLGILYSSLNWEVNLRQNWLLG